MRVSTNSIGNYQPTYMKAEAVNRHDAAQKVNNENILTRRKNFCRTLSQSQGRDNGLSTIYDSKGKVSCVCRFTFR